MKTALDLPDDLMLEIKIEAARRRTKLKDLIAELLRSALRSPVQQEPDLAHLVVDPRTGLLVVACSAVRTSSAQLTPARMAQTLLEQEEAWALEVSR